MNFWTMVGIQSVLCGVSSAKAARLLFERMIFPEVGKNVHGK